MKINNSFLRITAAATAMALALMLSGCGKKDGGEVTQPSESADINVPQNTVAPIVTDNIPTDALITAAEPDNTAAETLDEASETEAETSETEAATTPAPVTTTADEDDDDTENVDDEPNTRAMERLKLFNSNQVHAKFIMAESFDGEEILTTSIEYFINGSDRIYINNGAKTLIKNGTVTVLVPDSRVYYSYPEEGGYGLGFGYDRSKYKLVSKDGDEEVYEISGEDITSTWNFRADGTLRVSDRNANGSFVLYEVEMLESDVSMMDYSIPMDYVEVDADDYEFYR